MGSHRLDTPPSASRRTHRAAKTRRSIGLRPLRLPSAELSFVAAFIQWFLVALIVMYGISWTISRQNHLLNGLAITVGLWAVTIALFAFLRWHENREKP